MDIAIIGAGMAGLSCGAKLRAAGHSVSIFDKGRGPGGRMATRRAETGEKTLRFDHGAQYFTVKDERFAAQVSDWEKAGIVAPWPSAKEGAWVGIPGMNAPIKAMAEEADAQFGVLIEAIRREGKALWLLDAEGTVGNAFDAVLVAVPAEQVGPLVAGHNAAFADLAESTVSDPCWTLMAAFDAVVEHGDTLRDAGPIGWAARNSIKPGRDVSTECWVVQASPEWSRDHLEEDKDDVTAQLLDAFAHEIGVPLPTVLYATSHRWRFAQSGGTGDIALWDVESKIGVCGDWLSGPRVENAFVSGITLADRVIANG